jgi:hypothetical protein
MLVERLLDDRPRTRKSLLDERIVLAIFERPINRRQSSSPGARANRDSANAAQCVAALSGYSAPHAGHRVVPARGLPEAFDGIGRGRVSQRERLPSATVERCFLWYLELLARERIARAWPKILASMSISSLFRRRSPVIYSLSIRPPSGRTPISLPHSAFLNNRAPGQQSLQRSIGRFPTQPGGAAVMDIATGCLIFTQRPDTLARPGAVINIATPTSVAPGEQTARAIARAIAIRSVSRLCGNQRFFLPVEHCL